MTTPSPQKFSPTIPGYQPLLKQIKKTLLDGQARIEAERVRTYWETGRIIHTHILKNKDRADYGAQVVKQLGADLGYNVRILQYCLQFARTYVRPPIVNGRAQFKWTHYRELLSVTDPEARGRLEERAARHQWSAEELGLQIRESTGGSRTTDVKKKSPPAQGLLTPIRGQLYTYRFVSRPVLGDNPEGRELLLDLGFGVFKDIDARVAAKFTDQQIVESRVKDGQYTFASGERNAKDLFTYRAYIEKVVDGDTLKVRIDQGFDIWNRQILRLRDIDCPEVGTKEGDEVKNFVRSLLKEASLIVLRSSRSDKYDRYLADVFIPQDNTTNPINSTNSKNPTNSTNSTNSKNPTNSINPTNSTNDIYLNNLLLEKGYASRM
ncbi:MAG: thermonuclease family protein [Candidatus Omnitrophica bacterium]|nr:thermonuclease family protein [Candidatus Omnitrophota bacterium]